MRLKKILTWLLLLLSVAGFIYGLIVQSINEWFIIADIMTTAISCTHLIHLYSTNRKIKKVMKWCLYISTPLVVLSIFASIFTTIFNNPVFLIILFVSIFVCIISSLFLIVSNRKTDIFILIMMAFSLLGMFFKYKHWPGSGPLIVLGWCVPAILFLFIFYIKITEYDTRANKFLTFFKNYLCATMALCFMGGTFKIMWWPGGNILVLMGLPSCILAILSVVFLLPGSNFIEWTREHKRIFYYGLLIPMIYLSTLNSLSNVFPETFNSIMNKRPEQLIISPFYLDPYEIPAKEGL